jgi:hypothetical protein
VLKTSSFPFDPNDPRWAADYRTCIDESGGLFVPTECNWFCDAVVSANFTEQRVTGFGVGSIDCFAPDRPTIAIEYSETHCPLPVPP